MYEIVGVQQNERLMASDERAKELIRQFPHLFGMDWVAFRKVAATGMMDSSLTVGSHDEFVYTQRG